MRSAHDFDELYAAHLREPEATDDLLVLSFDAKGIAMRHGDLREATRKAAEETPRTLPNRKRMAQVAAIYSLPLWQRTIADVLHEDRRSSATHVWPAMRLSPDGYGRLEVRELRRWRRAEPAAFIASAPEARQS